MIRTIAFSIAALGLAAPAAAATYAGTPANPASESKFVSRDIIWTLADGSYRGSTNESRPLVLCQSLAKRAGQLQSFTVNGKPINPQDLARCNAVAPASNTPVLADAN